ncbi:MAG: hypothetical protein QOF21_1239 [Actinomycetota bacterium]
MVGFLVVAILSAAPVRPASAQGGTSRQTYTNGAGSRDYLLFFPGRTGPVPLIVYVHGCGAPPSVPGLNEMGEARGFAVAYPIQSRAANASGCWNWYAPEHQSRDTGEPSIIAGITRDVMRTRSIDPARVFITGHSAGSGMTANMSAAYPDLYAAAGLIAGCGQLTCRDVSGRSAFQRMGPRARAIPAYMLWGTADTTNRYPIGRMQLLQWLGMNDFADDDRLNASVPRLPNSVVAHPARDGEPSYVVEHYKDRRRCGEVEFASVIGMGHVPDAAWQSAFPSMVDFLLAHPMRASCS